MLIKTGNEHMSAMIQPCLHASTKYSYNVPPGIALRGI